MSDKPAPVSLFTKLKTANRKLLGALACYCVLIGIALYALLPARTYHEQFILGLVLFVFALLIAKTLIHSQDEKIE
jgi:hypothetical protein